MEKSGVPPPGFYQQPTSGPPPPPFYHEGQHNQQQQPNPAAPGVIFVSPPAFGPEPLAMTCPHCQASITTTVKEESNTRTHLFAILLCLIGGPLCACCPYCIGSCLVKRHYCPTCKTFLGQCDN